MASESSPMRRGYRRRSLKKQAEVFAGIIALASLGERLRGIDLIHFVDNLSALAGFIGGTATQEDCVAIFAIFHVLLVRTWSRSPTLATDLRATETRTPHPGACAVTSSSLSSQSLSMPKRSLTTCPCSLLGASRAFFSEGPTAIVEGTF